MSNEGDGRLIQQSERFGQWTAGTGDELSFLNIQHHPLISLDWLEAQLPLILKYLPRNDNVSETQHFGTAKEHYT